MIKVNEIFRSIQGEGRHVGAPILFIRLSGCNLNCSFCDTAFTFGLDRDEEAILVDLEAHLPIKRVCITGGEPLVQNITPLVHLLKAKGYTIHLETNGTLPITTARFDWITVSPKGFPLNRTTMLYADEVKFLCGFEGWEDVIEKTLKDYPALRDSAYLQPIWVEGEIKSSNLLRALEYIRQNPNIYLSVQVHKLIGVK